jgi:hypothetical protein
LVWARVPLRGLQAPFDFCRHANERTESLSTPRWESLEAWTRSKIQEALQAVLEEEVTELLGRVKSVRGAAVDAVPGYRNGYGKARRLSLTAGTITLRRPRVRGLEERREPGAAAVRAQGGSGRHAGLSGVHGERGCGAGGPRGAGAVGAPAGDRGRTFGESGVPWPRCGPESPSSAAGTTRS